MLCYILFVVVIFSPLSGNSLSHHAREKNIVNNSSVNLQEREKVDIKVFYESLCSGCRNEFSSTLVPLVNQMQDYINLEIFPFGNAKTLSTNKFQCQHGPAECYGNKIHACALFKLNVTLAVDYIACMMTEAQIAKLSHDKAALTCATSRNIDAEAIRGCAKSDLGDLLLMEAGLVSSAAKFPYVPYVLVNGKPVSGDLTDAVCSSYSHPSLLPPACVWYRRSGVM